MRYRLILVPMTIELTFQPGFLDEYPPFERWENRYPTMIGSLAQGRRVTPAVTSEMKLKSDVAAGTRLSDHIGPLPSSTCARITRDCRPK